jgi:hypothetical protein
LLLSLLLGLTLALAAIKVVGAHAQGGPSPAVAHAVHRATREHAAPRRPRRVDARLVRRAARETWRWQELMGIRRTRGAHAPTVAVLGFWRRHALRARRQALRPPHRSAWLCIHRYEGAWGDAGDPYWGGLQMDRGFMLRYAPARLLRRGWANRWSAVEQMWVGERALRSGVSFSAWPNTARLCGVL